MSSEDFKPSNAPQKTLSEWQQIASNHFASLSTSKKEKKLPVFSFEHSFTPIQLELILSLLVKDYLKNGINRSYWLLWVIYSTEIGYSYTGEEYWQSFEERISKWDSDHRENIRWAFKEFQKRYFGIEAKGPWAKHFSIISLPITNAILPKDLQSQFASLLYSSRFQLKQMSLSNPTDIGRLLSANSYSINSSRFQNFLQQEELVGRIALSLIDENTSDPSFELINSATLKRIVSDLEQKRNAREWVQETRREMKPKILGAHTSLSTKTSEDLPSGSTIKKNISLKPKLKLLQKESNTWSVVIEVPKVLDSLEDASAAASIKKARFQINGVKGNWIPAESLLHNSLKRRFDKWPDCNPLMKFEQISPTLLSLFGDRFGITKGPWVFIVGRDGLATEIEGKFIRPGKKYILLYDSPLNIPSELLTETNILCENIWGRELIVPNVITKEDEDKLKAWGFEVFKTLTIWPAGLQARSWDGEGSSEWLTTESPCFGILHDFELDELSIKMGSRSLLIKAKKPGEATFVSFDPLPVGQHVINIKPKSKVVSASEGLLLLTVRNPIIWTPGVALYNGLTAFLDPNDDDFDSFFRGKSELKIYAPQNRTITISVELIANNKIIHTYTSKVISLPFTSDKLKSIRTTIAETEVFGIAHKAKIKVYCEDIGVREFLLLRNVQPFRWSFHVSDGSMIRLIDETDSCEKIELTYYDLLYPDKPVEIVEHNYLQPTKINGSNGLYWAKKLDYEHAVIVSNVLAPKKDLAFLSISPSLSNSSDIQIIEYLKLIQRWYEAQCTSFLAQIHLEKIIEVLVQKLYVQLCGLSWSQEEFQFITNPEFNGAVESLSLKVKNKSIGNVVRFRLISSSPDELNSHDEITWFIGAAQRCGLSDDTELVKTVLKFASNPLSFLSLNNQELKSLTAKVVSNPDLLRATRLMALGVSKKINPHKNFALLIADGIKL